MIITDSADPVTLVAVSPKGDVMRLQVPIDPIKNFSLLDSNGAGDSWVGGFLAHLSASEMSDCPDVFELGEDFMKQAIKAGNFMAGQVVQRSGCSFPAVDELRELIGKKE